MKLPKAIVFMGKPGSGKTTQARKIVDNYGFYLYSTGDEFRKMAQEDSVIGRKVESVMSDGGLMPPWFASYMFQKTLLSQSDTQHIVFEGLGRRLEEAELFEEMFRFFEWDYLIFYLDLLDNVSTQRLVKRNERADDTPEIIKKRIEKYHEFTDVAVSYFREKGSLIEIDASRSQDEVFESIKFHVDSFGTSK